MNNLKEEIKNLKVAYTHAGTFHADDVFSAALLIMINPDIEIKRVFELPKDEEVFAFDIGCGKYDHHQSNAEIRDNGIKYAAFGLLCRDLFKDESPKFNELFEKEFVEPLDYTDNTGVQNQLSMVISAFNTQWNSSDNNDIRFIEAVSIAIPILEREIEKIKAIDMASYVVDVALSLSSDGIVVLPKYVPFKQQIEESTMDIKFVIYPSNRGGYHAQTVKINGTMDDKISFPEEYRCENIDNLKETYPSVTFCHPSGFLMAGTNKDDLISICKKLINSQA